MEFDRLPVKVLGCLGKEEITILIFPENGFVDGRIIERHSLKFYVKQIQFSYCELKSKGYIKLLKKVTKLGFLPQISTDEHR